MTTQDDCSKTYVLSGIGEGWEGHLERYLRARMFTVGYHEGNLHWNKNESDWTFAYCDEGERRVTVIGPETWVFERWAELGGVRLEVT